MSFEPATSHSDDQRPRVLRSRASVGREVADVVHNACHLVVDRLELLQFDLRETGQELAQRALFWALAGLFALGVLIAASVALGLALREPMGDALAALAVAAAHAVVVGVMVALARRPKAPSAADTEALTTPPGEHR